MRHFTLALLMLAGMNGIAQNIDKLRDEVVAEGKKLYRSEMASWYGSDIFTAEVKDRSNFGGYLSYTEDDISHAIFFSNDDKPKVLATVTFDQTYNVDTAKRDFKPRDFSKQEKDLYEIRQAAIARMQTDTIFKFYKNTNPNLIPLITGKDRKVYVLTGPSVNNVVIYGNDYLLTFDEKNTVKSVKRLHANIITVQYGDDTQVAIAPIHTHLPQTGEIMTATDICTTMLYEKLTGWESAFVMSEKYVSIWNCKTDHMVVMTTKAFRKMNENQDEPDSDKK
jgi:hypothetical protein